MTDYDEDTKTYQNWSITESLYSQLEWTTFLEQLGTVEGLNILELACGDGRLSRRLMERGANSVQSSDVSAAMIASAAAQNRLPDGSRRYPTLTYRVLDACDPDFEIIHPVELVTAMYLFHYASSEEKLNQMGALIGRNLRPGGRFLCYTINPDYDFEEQNPNMEEVFGFRYKIVEPPEYRLVIGDFEAHMWQWSKEAHEHALTEAGLRDIRWHPLKLPEESADKTASIEWYLENPSCIVVSARMPE
ncbi:MAG: class I SAM-dependent methyltransferase [Stappiaceae bacterium]